MFAQTCSLVLLPLVLAGAIAGLRIAREQRRLRLAALVPATVLVASAIGCLALMSNTTWWNGLPDSVRILQFPYRVNSWLSALLVVLCALTFGVLNRPHTTRTLPMNVLAVLVGSVALWYGGMAVYQALTAKAVDLPGTDTASHGAIDAGGLPPAFRPGVAQTAQFRMSRGGTAIPRPAETLTFDEGGRAKVPFESAGPYATNLVWSPFVRVEGGAFVGRDPEGWAVVRADDTRLAVIAAHPAPVTLGILVSALSGIGLLGAGVIDVRHVKRSRRAARRALEPKKQAESAPRATFRSQRAGTRVGTAVRSSRPS